MFPYTEMDNFTITIYFVLEVFKNAITVIGVSSDHYVRLIKLIVITPFISTKIFCQPSLMVSCNVYKFILRICWKNEIIKILIKTVY